MTMTGLSSSQVQTRRAQGQGNDVKLSTSRSYRAIITGNVLSPVNLVLYAIGLGMLMVGDTRSALTTVGLVVFNAIVGIIQEVRAKRKLDQIALLARSTITVVRDGGEQQVDPAEIVFGDIILVRAGDQVPVDGKLIGNGRLEVDESALTGESDLIPKGEGDELLSGSFCISGSSVMEATRVGEESFANKLTRNAREFKTEFTPLQRDVNRLLRLLLLLVLFFSILAVLALIVLDLPFSSWLQIMAVITGSVSAGLLTLITLNYSWGAVRIGQQGGLVQELNAIESLSNVTVLCTDKTGTLTANKIRFNAILPVERPLPEVETLLGNFAASATAVNKTSQALIDALPGKPYPLADEVPFSSARKWSAEAFTGGDGAPDGAYVLGALEMLEPFLTLDDAVRQQVVAWSEQGLRVLVFAGNTAVTTLHDAAGEPILPPLTLLGVVSFSDELRPHLKETLTAFAAQNVRLKVISGDNPQTVAALARQAGLPGDLRAVSGPELEQMSSGEFGQTVADATVFGRITPQQKEAIVETLRAQDEYVAMIGDGVNDVLSLKKANMGIAMESGSTATRAVAAMVLLGDSFAAMPPALSEGQRIVNSIQNILKLFMVTVFALLLLIIGITILNLGFPFTALQNTMLSFFARGAPPLVLALTAVSVRQKTSLSRNILHFTLPASFMLFLFGLLIYLGTFFIAELGFAEIIVTPEIAELIERTAEVATGTMTDAEVVTAAIRLSAQTALTTFFVYSGILLMVFAEPPTRWLAGGAPFRRRNWQTVAGAVALMAGFIVILLVPGLRIFFQLIPLPLELHLIIVALTGVWVFVQLVMWRRSWLERFLDMPAVDTAEDPSSGT